MGLFGGSKSSSTQVTEQIDARVVGGEASTNASITKNSGTINFTSTDHGAVAGSLALALKGVEGAQALASQTVEAQGGLLTGALKMAGEQQAAFTQALNETKNNDVRTLVLAGLAVVALAAFQMFKRG